jgi:type II secretory pathway pseudopilin PulG
MTSTKQANKGFTIIELLTVMSIVILLIGVLVPALNKTRIFAKKVVQKGQFHEISKGLELYRTEHQDTYPDSSAADAAGDGYCGAMKLCEALLGQDGMGFHPSSQFNAKGTIIEPNGTERDIYPFDLCNQIGPTDAEYASLIPNIQERIKYVDSENIKAARLKDLYSWYDTDGASYYSGVLFQQSTDTSPFDFPNAVITDVYLRAQSKCGGGGKTGMPVLYYKADPSKMIHDVNNMYGGSNPNIYNFDDNYAITALGCPWESAPPPVGAHPMQTNPLTFYKEITNPRSTSTPRPHNEDGYILMSAGYDGLYGTRDDVFNFTD